MREKIHAHTAANRGLLGASDVVKGLNKVIRGWLYIGAVSKAYRMMSRYIVRQFRQWLKKKHKWKTMGYKSYLDERIYGIRFHRSI
ncbi:MAG: hypothetical protein LBV23_09410 [Deltaproteobacteria bacterium]|nr:hypothetical protein [Deltaproteobacteria bacterium]